MLSATDNEIKEIAWSGRALRVLFALCVSAEAQQPTKIPRIGYLAANFASSESARTEAFRQGLRELGYVEGKNIVIECRFAEGKLDRVLPLAAELVRLKVDVIVTAGDRFNPCRQGSDEHDSYRNDAGSPILSATDSSPAWRDRRKHHWIVHSLPGLSGKRLELLKEIVPKLSRVAVLGTPTNSGQRPKR